MIRQVSSRIWRRLRKQTSPVELKPILPTRGWFETQQHGLKWRLCMEHYVDYVIAQQGVFEPTTTELVRKYVKPGMNILDVGANIGYFTLIFAQQATSTGKVWAFEPVKRYREQIQWHLEANQFRGQVHLLDYGLSEKKEEKNISIDNFGATLHWTSANPAPESEHIQLRVLDEVYAGLGLTRIDFVKVDVDGHEPFFLRGASRFFQQFRPVTVIEFSQANLDIAGEDVRTLKALIEDMDFVLYSEVTRKPFVSRREFLEECGNFTHSANVWAIPSELSYLSTLDEIAQNACSLFSE